jgi:hypothetical protein
MYVGTGLANIFGERTPCKKLADLHPRQGNYFKGTLFQRSTKPLFASQNRMEISLKKILPFFKHASSSVAPKISMGATYCTEQGEHSLQSRHLPPPANYPNLIEEENADV